MRLFLLPISTRRTLLYCERQAESLQHQTSLIDKAQNRAAKMWSDWEKKPPGSIQHRIVSSGNAGLRRIAFEEWGLKSVPPLSARKRAEEAAAAAAGSTTAGDEPSLKGGAVVKAGAVEVLYPASAIPPENVAGVLARLATEREALHRQRLLWCFVGMPITAPFGLVPVVPNIPFFYLAYRAWSHWRALSGGKHIQHLLENDSLVYKPSPVLDAIYAKERAFLQDSKPAIAQTAETGSALAATTGADVPERLLLSNPGGSKAIADAYDAPALELELERAIWQVETALEKEEKERAGGSRGGTKTPAAAEQPPQQQQQDKQPPGRPPTEPTVPMTKQNEKPE